MLRCLVSLAERVMTPDLCLILLNNIMNLNLLIIGNLVPAGPSCVLYNKPSNLLKV